MDHFELILENSQDLVCHIARNVMCILTKNVYLENIAVLTVIGGVWYG